MITVEIQLAIESIEREIATLETALEQVAIEMDSSDPKMSDVIKMTTLSTTIANMKSLLHNMQTVLEVE